MGRLQSPAEGLQLRFTDPLSAVITEAVQAAVEARLPAIIAAITSAIVSIDTRKASSASPERFVSMKTLEDLLDADRTTIRRRSERGVYPPLRKQGTSVGFYQSDLDRIFAKSEDG